MSVVVYSCPDVGLVFLPGFSVVSWSFRLAQFENAGKEVSAVCPGLWVRSSVSGLRAVTFEGLGSERDLAHLAGPPAGDVEGVGVSPPLKRGTCDAVGWEMVD